MGNWRDSIPSKWLKAKDLEGRPQLVTIKKFSVEKITDDKQGPVIWFQEYGKGLGLNITNGKKVEAISGSGDPANWIGKRIVIFPTETEFQGDTVDCIRVRAPRPGTPQAQPVTAEPEPEDHFTPNDDDVPF